jgi:hypothetical protein
MESSMKNYKWLIVWVFVFLFSPVVDAASDPAIIEAAKKEGQLTLWTSSDLRTASRVVERFEQKYSFLKVKIFRTGTGALHNKMITEATGRPTELGCDELPDVYARLNQKETAGPV